MSLSANLQHYWSFDASNADDSITGDALNGTSTDITYSSGNGKLSIGAGFNGTSSDIIFSSNNLDIANAWTFSFWLKAVSFTGNPRIVFMDNGSTANDIVLVVSSGGVLSANVFDSSAVLFKDLLGTASMSTGTFYFKTITWDGTNLLFYHNASLDATTGTNDPGTMTSTARVMRFSGTNTNTAMYSGALDEVGLWSRALSASEVSQLYNGGSGLAYPFPESTNSNFFVFM